MVLLKVQTCLMVPIDKDALTEDTHVLIAIHDMLLADLTDLTEDLTGVDTTNALLTQRPVN